MFSQFVTFFFQENSSLSHVVKEYCAEYNETEYKPIKRGDFVDFQNVFGNIRLLHSLVQYYGVDSNVAKLEF